MTRTTSTTIISTSPALARTDGAVAAAASREGRYPASDPRPVDASFVRRRGVVLAAGAATWAIGTFAVGTTPESSLGITVQDLTGLAFQVGVMALLSVQARTLATGTGRVARRMVPVERVVLALAMVWSAVHGLAPALRDAPWLAVLDACWPLSMLGMFVLGIKVAVAGRWRGAARVWPLVAESWAVVTVPTFVIAGEAAGVVVGGLHLLVGYTTLGVLLAMRPGVVLPRR
jgi:hypothetical protein